MNRYTISIIFISLLSFPHLVCQAQSQQSFSPDSWFAQTQPYDLVDSIAQMLPNRMCVDALGELAEGSPTNLSHHYAEAAYTLAQELGDSLREKRGLLRLAHAYLEQKNAQEARKSLDRFFSGNITFLNDSVLAWSELERSRLLKLMKDITGAYEAIEKAEVLVDTGKHPSLAIAIQLQKGAVQSKKQDYHATYQTFEAIYLQSYYEASTLQQYHILRRLARTLYDLNKYPEAIQWSDSLASFYQYTGYKPAKEYSLAVKSLALMRLGKYDEAIKWSHEGIALCVDLKDSLSLCNHYHTIGIINLITGNLDSAIQYNETNLKIRTQVADTNGMIASYINLSIALRYLDQLDKALTYLKAALELVKYRPFNPNLGGIYESIGQIHLRLGQIHFRKQDYTWAEFYFQKGLETYKLKNDSVKMAFALNKLGSMYTDNMNMLVDKEKRYTLAKKYITQSNQLAEQFGVKAILGSNYYNLAIIAAEGGIYQDGIRHAKHALAIAQTDDPKMIMEAYHLLSVNYRKAGDLSTSVKYGEKALEMARKDKKYERYSKIAQRLSTSYHKIGQDKRAYSLLNEYVTFMDSMNNDSVINDLKGLNIQYKDSLLMQQKELLAQENDILLKQDKIRQLELSRKQGLILILGIGLIVVFLSLGLALYQYKQTKLAYTFLQESQLLRQKAENHKNRLIKLLMHDLKAPLSLIRSSLFILQIEKEQTEENYDLIQDSQQACENIMQLSLQTGELSSPYSLAIDQQNGFQRFSPPAILNEINAEFRPLANSFQVDLEVQKGEEEIEVTNNPMIIRHILGNLVHNALKFSKTGAKVIITYTNEIDRFIYKVKDNGPGIPLEVQNRIFQLDERDKKQPHHGLALSQKLAASLGAKISFETQLGKGTVFYLSIPQKTFL